MPYFYFMRTRVRTRIKIKKSRPNKKFEIAKDNLHPLLFLTFFIALLIQCIALYKQHFHLYGIVRVIIIPILIIRIIVEVLKVDYKPHFLLIAGLIISYIADIFTFVNIGNLSVIGINIYTISYIAFACFIFQSNSFFGFTYTIFFSLSVLVGIGITCLLLFPKLENTFFYIQLAIHILILCFLVFTAIDIRKRMKSKAQANMLLAAVVVIVITNITYGIDILHRRIWLDALVGFGNGIYLFLIVRTALKGLK